MSRTIVGLHRPFSDISYDPLESISSCSRKVPEDRPSQEARTLHTMRCLRSIEAQIRLLALPTRTFCHSPFSVCAVVTGTIPLLSACKFLFTGKRLATARDQIRLSIGCLKSFARVWPRGARIVREIQTIACELLGLPSKGQERPACTAGSTGMSSDASSSSSDPTLIGDAMNHFTEDPIVLPALEGLPNAWDLNEVEDDLSMWFPSGS